MSILEPSLDTLMSKVDSKYALVVAAAKRGRQITDGHDRVSLETGPKAVSLALKEIVEGTISLVEPEKPVDPMLLGATRR